MVSVDLPEAVWNYLRWNAYLSTTYKLLYISTPKVACTSLKWWFASLAGYAKALSEYRESGESDPDLVIHDSFHKVAPHVTGLESEALAPAIVSENYFRFAVVRNPYKRIFSAWQSKLLLQEPLQSQPYLECDFFRHPIESVEDIRSSFEGFLEHLAFKEAPDYLDVHWTPQADLLRPDLIPYTKLAQIENLHELNAALSEHLGPHFANPFLSRRTNESLLSFSRELITERAAELIRMLYARDFEMFGYESHLPDSTKESSAVAPDIALQAIKLIRARHQMLTNTRLASNKKVSQLNGIISEFTRDVRDLNQTISNLDQTNSGLHQGISNLNQTVATRDKQIAALQRNLKSASDALIEIRNSTSWKIGSRITRLGSILFPRGSRRERMVRLSIQGLQTWRREGLKVSLQKAFLKVKQAARSRVGLSPIQVDSPSLTNDPYVPINEFDVDSANVLVKTIAFYLPQFHPIPENDAWWGKGFTEWTNVSKAQPNFEGHYQPHLPDELGYYDLRVPEIQKRQVELAKKYGIYGFCFYYYWFAGKRLLERPLNQYRANSELDLPFCLCWANENWTRRWDGAEQEVLIGQTHNEQEYLHFIEDISPYFKDPRYIRIDGKPVLLVYRINLLPNPQTAARIWRDECKRLGIGDIYLIAVQSFGITDPRPYGFDAAVEFPPSYLGAADVDPGSLKLTNPNFKGKILDYHSAANIMIQRRADGYPLFKTVMLAWDNTARRQNDSHIFINATPSAYQSWLENVVTYTRNNLPRDQRFVFINAWNEWAEGTHLEPDRRYGYAYLQATADAIQDTGNKRFPFPTGWKILFVSHDANKGGAQSALLSTLEWFKEHTSLSLKVLCLEGGPLLPHFRALADTIVLSELRQAAAGDSELTERLLDFCNGTPSLIYGNTVVAGKAYPWLHTLGVPILTHAYELEMSIQRYASEWIADVLKFSTHYITPSNAVKDNLVKNHAVDPDKITVVYGAVSNESIHMYESTKEKRQERKRLGLEAEKVLIVGCGLGMPFRKGADLFIELADVLRQRGQRDFHFYWIGSFEDSERDPKYGVWSDHKAKLTKDNLTDFVTFLGYRENFRDYFRAADIFVLPSREDPLPLVAIEAAKCGLPLVCFAEAGGTPDLVGDDAGFVVPFEDVETMADNIHRLMSDPALRMTLGKRAREKFLSQFTVERTTPKILSTCRKIAGKKPAVSVIVPNYNHVKYLPQRLESIFDQTFQDFEVILLDDASTDNSLEVLQQYMNYSDVRLHRNEQNSGSPFKQWSVGLVMARADILWIAESDDVCKPEFLEKLLPAFRNPAVKLAYANSDVIDEEGGVIGDYSSDKAKYLATLSATKWKNSYTTTADQEINDGLGIKNTILNASAVLLRKFDMSLELKEMLAQMRIAGDWYCYVHAIKNGKLYYDSRKWNSHRRHSSSVIAQTVSDHKIKEFFQEFALVHKYVFNTYQLDPTFEEKWEQYLLQQLRDFTLDASYEVLRRYYPVDEMQALIAKSETSHHSKEKTQA
jgi:glycosyltransferase involved in cell wall biosynthesis